MLSPTNVRWSARSASGEATTTVPYGVSRPERSLNSPKRSPGALPILGRELDFGDIGISHSADVAPRPVDQAGLPPRPVHSPFRKVGHGASRHTLTGDGLLRALSEDNRGDRTLQSSPWGGDEGISSAFWRRTAYQAANEMNYFRGGGTRRLSGAVAISGNHGPRGLHGTKGHRDNLFGVCRKTADDSTRTGEDREAVARARAPGEGAELPPPNSNGGGHLPRKV